MAMRGLYTGIWHTSFVAASDCIVWLATCPMLSPVIRPKHLSSSAKCSAIFIMYLRMMMVSSSCGHFSYMASCISVKLTTCSFILPEYLATFFARSTTFCFALSLVYGGAWKYVALITTPRFAIMYPATGLSIPPESRSIAFPAVPSGIPPGPGISSE